jgi:uncharacterized protein (TIGR01732 family)
MQKYSLVWKRMKYIFCIFAITGLLFTGSSGMLSKAFAIQSISLNEQLADDEIDRDWLIDTAQTLVVNGLNDGVLSEQQQQSSSLQEEDDVGYSSISYGGGFVHVSGAGFVLILILFILLIIIGAGFGPGVG